jgi:hypothetical protein
VRGIEPAEPLRADVKQALMELVEFQKQADAGLEGLDPPEDAEEPVEKLIEALRDRTETFEIRQPRKRKAPQTQGFP